MYTSFARLAMFSLFISLVAIACKKDDDTTTTTTVNSQTVSNLNAPADVRDMTTGQVTTRNPFVKFSIAQNQVITTDDWDIAFKGTTILINGGTAGTDSVARTGTGAAVVKTSTFDALTAAPDDSEFAQDAASGYAIPTGSGNGWYNYDAQTHLISPIPGRVLVIRTHDNKFAKIEILSYYKDAPATPSASSQANYYTFRFTYQADGSKNFN